MLTTSLLHVSLCICTVFWWHREKLAWGVRRTTRNNTGLENQKKRGNRKYHQKPD
jgi:hypothetical protein